MDGESLNAEGKLPDSDRGWTGGAQGATGECGAGGGPHRVLMPAWRVAGEGGHGRGLRFGRWTEVGFGEG